MVKFFDIYEQDKDKFHKNISDFKNIIKNTNFVNGKQVFAFEKNFAKFCNTKYAVGCTYKYLNGGPGSPAFIYANKQEQNSLKTPIRGWFSHSSPFDYSKKYEENNTMDRFKSGTPHIIQLSALEKGASLSKVANLWYKDKGKVTKNPLIKYLNMDEIPDQRLDFWDEKHFRKPYDGKLYNTGFFETS